MVGSANVDRPFSTLFIQKLHVYDISLGRQVAMLPDIKTQGMNPIGVCNYFFVSILFWQEIPIHVVSHDASQLPHQFITPIWLSGAGRTAACIYGSDNH
jgi:hypothetical protein